MKKSIVLMLVLCSSVVFAEDQEQRFIGQSIVGSYAGEAFNGSDLDPVITSFSLGGSGRLAGKYVVNSEEGPEHGTLTDFRMDTPYAASMTWHDRYGQGTLRIIFSENYSSFVGFWGSDKFSTSLPWNGVKQRNIL